MKTIDQPPQYEETIHTPEEMAEMPDTSEITEIPKETDAEREAQSQLLTQAIRNARQADPLERLETGIDKAAFNPPARSEHRDHKPWFRRAAVALTAFFALGGAAKASEKKADSLVSQKTVTRTINFEHGNETYKPSTPEQRNNWNAFLNYLQETGYRGNKALDARDRSLGLTLLKEYNNTHPAHAVSEDFISVVQYENSLMRQGLFPGMNEQTSQELIKAAPYLKSYEERDISPEDNWLGSITSTLHYPTVKKMTNKHEEYDYGTDLSDFLAGNSNEEIAAKYKKVRM